MGACAEAYTALLQLVGLTLNYPTEQHTLQRDTLGPGRRICEEAALN